MAISKRLRYEILQRDNHMCRYCGATARETALTIDHVIPQALGGTDTPDNLVAACGPCNAGKTSTAPDAPLVDDVAQDALRWAEAMKKAAHVQTWRRHDIEAACDAFDHEWLTAFGPDATVTVYGGPWASPTDPDTEFPWAVVDLHTDRPLYLAYTEDSAEAWLRERQEALAPPRPDDWEHSVQYWHAAGITNRDLYVLAVEVSKKRHVSHDGKWKYFCGCVWNTLRERQQIARDLLSISEDGGS